MWQQVITGEADETKETQCDSPKVDLWLFLKYELTSQVLFKACLFRSCCHYCCCSVTKLWLILLTPWTIAHQASLSFTVSWSLLKLMSIETVMLSINLILCFSLHLLSLILPSLRVLLQWISPSHLVTKILELQLQHQSFQLIFRVDFLQDWLVWSACSTRNSQDSFPAPQFESINSLVLSLLYGPTLISIHIRTWLLEKS